MKKSVRLAACGLAAMMLATGCSKSNDAVETTAASAAAGETAAGETTAAADAAATTSGVVKLGEYKGLEAESAALEVTDEEVEEYIQGVLRNNQKTVEVTDRVAADGDKVNIDFVGMLDGVAFEGGTASGYDLVLGSDSFIDGFEDGLLGVMPGEKVSLNLTFPEDYHSTDLAGKAVVFDVTLNYIKETEIPTLTDEYVAVNSDYQTIAEYTAAVRKALLASKENQLMLNLLSAVVESSEFELDEARVNAEYEKEVEYYQSMIKNYYGMELGDYLAVFGQTEESFHAELKSNAELIIKQELIVDAIAEAEGKQVDDATRTEAIEFYYGMDVDTAKATYGEEDIERAAKTYVVVNLLKDHAVMK